MKKLVLAALFLLSSCAIFKEKSRSKTDSLLKADFASSWKLNRQLESTAYQTRESLKVVEVLIKADAPFKWQIDSGLTGKAGTYHVSLLHKDESTTNQAELKEENTTSTVQQHQTEVRKYLQESKTVSKKFPPQIIIWGLVVLVFVVFCWKWGRYFMFL